MASLQHLGGNRWRTTVYIGRDIDGRQKRRSAVFSAPTRSAAQKIAEEERVKLRQVEADARAATGTFGAYRDQWLAESATRLAPATIESYTIQSAKAVARFGRRKVADITRADVRAWYAEMLAAGISAASLDHVHTVLRMILRQAHADGLTPTVATFKVPRPAVRQRRFNLPADRRIQAAIDAARPDLIVAATLAANGMRRAEVTRARWGDLTGRDLTVRGTKSETSARTITLGWRTMRVLAAHRRRQVDDARRLGRRIAKRAPSRPIIARIEIDPTARTPYDPTWLTREWRATADDNGCPKMHFHDLRHWAASRLFAVGTPLHEVTEQLGHSKASTTLDIYGQVLDKSAQRRARGKALDL